MGQETEYWKNLRRLSGALMFGLMFGYYIKCAEKHMGDMGRNFFSICVKLD